MKNGTYNLSFVMMYTVTSESGSTVHVPFGERYQYTVTVATPASSVASSGVSKFIKSGTPKAIIPQNVAITSTQGYMSGASTETSRQFTANTPVIPVKSPGISSYSQFAATTVDNRKIISENSYSSTPLPEAEVIVTQQDSDQHVPPGLRRILDKHLSWD